LQANYNEVSETFGGGTAPALNFSLFDIQERLAEIEFEYNVLKGERTAIMEATAKGSKELAEAEKAYEKTKRDLRAKRSEIEAKIAEKVTQLRKELKDKFKIDSSTINRFADDNRIKYLEHLKVQKLLKDIRYLEHFDDGQDSTVANENTALKTSEDITKKCLMDCGLASH
jgi:seryl-tRNA synthetase